MSTLDRNEKGTLIAVAGIILAGGVVGIVLGRADPPAQDVPDPVSPAPGVAPAPIAATEAPPPPAISAPGKPAAAFSESDLARLAEESMSGPPALRLAAIERLAAAPRDQSLPLLKRVLLNGDPAIDRPAALSSLRELALAQGDGDGRIRDAVREIIYHGDDAALATRAQETLDAIGRLVPGGRSGS